MFVTVVPSVPRRIFSLKKMLRNIYLIIGYKTIAESKKGLENIGKSFF